MILKERKKFDSKILRKILNKYFEKFKLKLLQNVSLQMY